MVWIFRTTLLLFFALYWGGLTFYTGIVVQVAHNTLSDGMEGGLITQQVTIFLQWLGIATSCLLLVNARLTGRIERKPGRFLFVCSTVLLLCLIGKFAVHESLDQTIDVVERTVTNRAQFVAGHRYYNQLTLLEWLCCVMALPASLIGWKRIDSRPAAS